jgi:hypothetical protein
VGQGEHEVLEPEVLVVQPVRLVARFQKEPARVVGQRQAPASAPDWFALATNRPPVLVAAPGAAPRAAARRRTRGATPRSAAGRRRGRGTRSATALRVGVPPLHALVIDHQGPRAPATM